MTWGLWTSGLEAGPARASPGSAGGSRRGETTFVIVARDAEGWCVQVRDGSSTLWRHGARSDALYQARTLAHRHAPAELIVFRTDGRQQSHCRFEGR